MSFKGITIINGIKQESTAAVILDQGINFGRGVFETIAVVGGVPIFLEKHCRRLRKGLAALGINNSVCEAQIADCIRQFGIRDCGMKVMVTPENIVVTTRANVYTADAFKEGFKVGISTLKRNPHSHTVFHKTLNYTDNILEKEIASKAGFDEVIFTNVYDKLAEGSISNLFFVSAGKIYTPAISCGLLNGIVRSFVIENFKVEGGQYTAGQLMEADEVFLTNSLMGIMPVRQLQEKVFGGAHRKCSEVRKAYDIEVKRELVKYQSL